MGYQPITDLFNVTIFPVKERVEKTNKTNNKSESVTENNSKDSKAIKLAMVTWADKVRYGSRTVEEGNVSGLRTVEARNVLGLKKLNVCALGRVPREISEDKYVRARKNSKNHACVRTKKNSNKKQVHTYSV